MGIRFSDRYVKKHAAKSTNAGTGKGRLSIRSTAVSDAVPAGVLGISGLILLKSDMI